MLRRHRRAARAHAQLGEHTAAPRAEQPHRVLPEHAARGGDAAAAVALRVIRGERAHRTALQPQAARAASSLHASHALARRRQLVQHRASSARRHAATAAPSHRRRAARRKQRRPRRRMRRSPMAATRSSNWREQSARPAAPALQPPPLREQLHARQLHARERSWFGPEDAT